jgi:radical SAM protein with 4Fe4S-binding SPASM domain
MVILMVESSSNLFVPFNRFKILTYYNEINEILKGEIPYPRMVELFLSFACDHKCLGCHSANLRADFDPFIDYEKCINLINDLVDVGVKALEFGGGGEPLMYPKFKEVVEHCAKLGLEMGLVTNGTHFDESLMRLCIKHFTYIRVALDGGTRETYKSIHNVDLFERLLENIKRLVEIKKETGSKCMIGLKYLASKSNFSDIPKAAEIARELGVDYLQFKALRNSEYELNEEEMKKVNKIIADVKEENKKEDLFILGNVSKATSGIKCFLSPLIPVISTNGDVFLCPFYQIRKDRFTIGNVFEKPFKEIWGSKRHKEAIKNIDIGECTVYDCPLQEAMKIVREAIIKNKLHVKFI